MMEQNLTQNVDTLFMNMENFAQKEGLIGKPVTQGDKTFLPILSVTLGYGGGDMHPKSQQANTSGLGTGTTSGAVGLGAKLCTDAVIIINKEEVSLIPLSGSGNVTQMIDKIPQIITNLNPGGGQKTQQQQQNGQQQ